MRSPLAACVGASSDAACAQVFKELKNPYYLGDEVGLTQSLGWVGAWTSQPSVYAVAAKTTADVVAAVNFARKNNLRIVVKGGGHSYQGTSNAADSLLIWTRHMNAIVMHDAFVGAGCAGQAEPQPAVSIEAGAYWRQAYDAVTTKGGRYVQGGGCMTVGVAGLVLGGGFGSFSKAYGMAGGEPDRGGDRDRRRRGQNRQRLFESRSLLGAQRRRRRVRRRHPRDPAHARAARILRRRIRDRQGDVRRRLPPPYRQDRRILRASAFQSALGRTDPLWAAASSRFRWSSRASIEQQAEAVWKPFFDWVAASPQDFAIVSAPRIGALPAQRFWDPSVLKSIPGLVIADDRQGAPADNIFWAGNLEEAGAVWYAYQSAWLPASLLEADRRQSLADALFAAAKHQERGAALQQGACGRAGGSDRRGEGYGDEPGGHRRLRAGDQRRTWESPPIPAFPDMSRMRRPREASSTP